MLAQVYANFGIHTLSQYANVALTLTITLANHEEFLFRYFLNID